MAVVKTKPVVACSTIADQKMRAFCLEGYRHDMEVSMIGVTASNEEMEKMKESKSFDFDYYIVDVYPVKQECSSVYTEMDEESLIEKRMELREEGYGFERQNVHFHTHPNMGVSPSATDEKLIEGFEADSGHISIIMNENYALSGDTSGLYVRLDLWKPFRQTFEKLRMVVDTVSLVPDGWASECFEAHVSERPKKVVKYAGCKTATSYPKGYPQYMRIADAYSLGAQGWGAPDVKTRPLPTVNPYEDEDALYEDEGWDEHIEKALNENRINEVQAYAIQSKLDRRPEMPYQVLIGEIEDAEYQNMMWENGYEDYEL